MTRKRLNRLWARPFDSSSSCMPSRGPRVEGGEKGGGERKRLVEKKGIPSMVANGLMGQRETRRRRRRRSRRPTRGEEKRAGDGMRNSRWLRFDVFIRAALVWLWDIYLSCESEGRRQKIRSSVKIA